MVKELGKIKNICFGFGGFDDAMFGVSVVLGGEGWGTRDFKGAFPGREDTAFYAGQACVWLHDLMKAAKKEDLADMVGVPVEVTFENRIMTSWRVLTEVV